MGQVIEVDFAARASTATRSTVDPSSIPAPMLIPLKADPVGASATPMVTEAVSTPVLDSSRQVARPVATADAGEHENLVDACARMRADTAALRDAVEKLRRATADLHRLPALARELCEAAV